MSTSTRQPTRRRYRPGSARSAAGKKPSRSSIPEWVWTPLVVAALGGAAISLCLLQPTFVYLPDELLYQHLARSLAAGEGFRWRGETVVFNAALYVYAIAPAWIVANGEAAYAVAKVETAIFCASVALPIWLLARTVLPPRLTALAVALSLGGSWMASAGSLLTESLAIPLATAGLAAMAHGLRCSSSRWIWAAFGLALLATWARLQVVVILPALFVAIVLDAAWARGQRRQRLQAFRGPLVAGVVLAGAIAAVMALGGASVIGGYDVIFRLHVDPGKVVIKSGSELLMLAAACGFVPLPLLLSVIGRRDAWRESSVGPVLAVVVPAVAVLAIENGYYIATGGYWPIQRYMMPVAPMLLLLVLVLAHSGIVSRRTLSWTAVASLVLLLTPAAAGIGEQRAVFATVERMQALLPGAPAGVCAVIVALSITGTALLVHRRSLPCPQHRLATALGMGILGVLLVQTGTAWRDQLQATRLYRQNLPGDVAWLEHHSHGRVAVLELTSNSPSFDLVDFFNHGISRYYALQGSNPGPYRVWGPSCSWSIGALNGHVTFEHGCPPDTNEFFINDPAARLKFYDETSSASNARLGRVVRVRGRPRLLSAVFLPCDRSTPHIDAPGSGPVPCRPELDIRLWLRKAGTVLVKVAGSPQGDYSATVNNEITVPIRSGKTTTLPIGVKRGAQQLTLDFDWTDAGPASPRIVGIVLRQGNDVERLS